MTSPTVTRTGLSPSGGGPVPYRPSLDYRIPPHSPTRALTEKQIGILRLAANGCTNAVIAHRLGVGYEAVTAQMQKIFRKLRVQDRAQAVAVALRLGVLPLNDVAVPENANYDFRHDTVRPTRTHTAEDNR